MKTGHAILARRQFVRKKKAVTALQAAARGLRDRREFEQIRQKASATLIINKHVREWLKRKKQEDRLETVKEMDTSDVNNNRTMAWKEKKEIATMEDEKQFF